MVTVQYSGDQPPSLQQLINIGQLPPETREGDVTFVRVEEGGAGVGQSSVSGQRTVTVHREQRGSSEFGMSGGREVSVEVGQVAVAGGMATIEGQMQEQIEQRVTAGGQMVVAGGEIEVR